jgi:hypothetical protein
VRDLRLGSGPARAEFARGPAHRGSHRRGPAGQGLEESAAQPGLHVTYHASTRAQRSLQVWDSGRFFGGMGSVDVKTIQNGTLVVDIGDASRQLISRAVAKDTLSDKPEKNQKKLDKTMEKMFKTLPPATTS